DPPRAPSPVGVLVMLLRTLMTRARLRAAGHGRGERRRDQRQQRRGDPHPVRVSLAGQRLRERGSDGQPGVVGQPDVAHRATAPPRAGAPTANPISRAPPPSERTYSGKMPSTAPSAA